MPFGKKRNNVDGNSKRTRLTLCGNSNQRRINGVWITRRKKSDGRVGTSRSSRTRSER